MRDRTWVMLIAGVVLAADQVTKYLVSARIPFQERIPLVDDLLALTHVRNTGAAFGLFADAPAGPVRIGLVIVSVLAVGLIWAYARDGWHEPRIVVAFGLILGGALGNLLDRVRLHYVVDFIDVHWGAYHWPSFNVADMAITTGALVLFVAMAIQGDADEELPARSETADGFANLTAPEGSTEKRAAEDAARLG